MNERIRELAEQCYDPEYGFIIPEKFALLIVRECIDICKEQEYKYWRSSEEDHWTPIDSANAIKQHFGVEE
jgi:hypothetical protein